MSMHSEFDPDDNFAHSFALDADIDEDAAIEALVWQLLLLINPGDEQAAMEQFAAWQEAAPLREAEDPVWLIRDVIDWKAGFHIEEADTRALLESLDELASRRGLRIAWGVEDEDDLLEDADPPLLINTAYDRLREYHHTLWTWETGSDAHAGWITRSRDDEALRMVAAALGFHVRTGAG